MLIRKLEPSMLLIIETVFEGSEVCVEYLAVF